MEARKSQVDIEAAFAVRGERGHSTGRIESREVSLRQRECPRALEVWVVERQPGDERREWAVTTPQFDSVAFRLGGINSDLTREVPIVRTQSVVGRDGAREYNALNRPRGVHCDEEFGPEVDPDGSSGGSRHRARSLEGEFAGVPGGQAAALDRHVQAGGLGSRAQMQQDVAGKFRFVHRHIQRESPPAEESAKRALEGVGDFIVSERIDGTAGHRGRRRLAAYVEGPAVGRNGFDCGAPVPPSGCDREVGNERGDGECATFKLNTDVFQLRAGESGRYGAHRHVQPGGSGEHALHEPSLHGRHEGQAYDQSGEAGYQSQGNQKEA